MADKKAYHPDGSCILFNEAEHKYTVNGKQFISATTVLGQFFPKFEADKIAYFVAKREGRTKEDVLQEWEDKKNDACDFGNAVHLYAERKLMGGAIPRPKNEREKNAFQLVEKYIKGLLKDYVVIEAEKIVFSKRHGVSGTIDLVLQHKKSKNICLLDWKTNKKIQKKNSYSKPAFPPIEELNDSNFTKYMLQLNLYKYILETEGYIDGEVDNMILLHIRPSSTKAYEVPDAQEEIKTILKYRDEALIRQAQQERTKDVC